MITTRLTGGLGNQMFQFAAGMALAERHHTDLTLDLSHYWPSTQKEYRKRGWISADRRFELDIFQHRAHILGRDEPRLLSRIKTRLKSPSKILKESGFAYNPDFDNAPDGTTLDGLWTSERYFHQISSIILNEFKFVRKSNKQNQQLLEQISKSTSVALHVRRGDYATSQNTTAYHGLTTIQYYKTAVEEMLKKFPSAHFFVFSDDPDWSRKHLDFLSLVTYISNNNGVSSWEDLRLMSSCQHNIIANSTFSWWGAWLNSNPEKVVYAPKQWFAGAQLDTQDLIPKTWIRL